MLLNSTLWTIKGEVDPLKQIAKTATQRAAAVVPPPSTPSTLTSGVSIFLVPVVSVLILLDCMYFVSLSPSPLVIIPATHLCLFCQVCLRHYEHEFMELACNCPVVVCCRCSPQQKADIVRLLKKHTGKRACAIGESWIHPSPPAPPPPALLLGLPDFLPLKA